MEFTVEYKIQVTADNPVDAALEVEEIMLHPDFRPFLTVISSDGIKTNIDLELGNINE